ncbi:unnamed protein product [Lupinus luteus]|uniref:Uncharacterized protein n=1 Tax=Lupinus luteus TaxID=3873 RepID=A0AAV1VRH8_LUPLU
MAGKYGSQMMSRGDEAQEVTQDNHGTHEFHDGKILTQDLSKTNMKVDDEIHEKTQLCVWKD